MTCNFICDIVSQRRTFAMGLGVCLHPVQSNRTLRPHECRDDVYTTDEGKKYGKKKHVSVMRALKQMTIV